MLVRWTLVALTAITVILGACGHQQHTLLVAAAADLRFAALDLVAAFEEECQCQVNTIFASSGTLNAQIRGGLRADVLLSAHRSNVDQLREEGLVIPETIRIYALGLLALATPASSPLEAHTVQDLADSRFRRIAIANPQHAPYGQVAQELLIAAGLWTSVQPRLVIADNVAQVFQWVEEGQVDAALISVSLAIVSAKVKWVLVEPELYEPLPQAGAVLSRAPSPQLARQFLDLVTGPRGREILARYGFILPS